MSIRKITWLSFCLWTLSAGASESSFESTPSLQSSFDMSFSGGGATVQGFSLPVARVTLDQPISKRTSGLFSLGQSREYTGALLPTLIPVDASLNFRSVMESTEAEVSWKLGMFNPAFVPWWTQNLQDLPYLPNYSEVHPFLFLNREIGAEIQFEPVADRSAIFVGVFNGSGIFGQNSNNSRAYTLGARWTFEVGGGDLEVGASGLVINQSQIGSVNYRASNLLFGFVDWDLPELGLFFAVEGYSGHVEDSASAGDPYGLAFFTQWSFSTLISLFLRVEQMYGYSRGDGNLFHFQFGPTLTWSEQIQTFFLFSQLSSFGSGTENVGMVRTRVSFGN